jgi:hypothetical protein
MQYIGEQYLIGLDTVANVANIRNEQIPYGEEVENPLGMQIGFFSAIDLDEKDRIEGQLNFEERLL